MTLRKRVLLRSHYSSHSRFNWPRGKNRITEMISGLLSVELC